MNGGCLRYWDWRSVRISDAINKDREYAVEFIDNVVRGLKEKYTNKFNDAVEVYKKQEYLFTMTGVKKSYYMIDFYIGILLIIDFESESQNLEGVPTVFDEITQKLEMDEFPLHGNLEVELHTHPIISVSYSGTAKVFSCTFIFKAQLCAQKKYELECTRIMGNNLMNSKQPCDVFIH